MEPAAASLGQLLDASKHFARRLFTIGENRLELLIVEVQEERMRLLKAIMLLLSVAVFGFFALLALNIIVVVLLWNTSPLGVLVGLTIVHASIAFALYRRLITLLRDWKMLSATLEQLGKDRACLG